ncbi:Stage III sporulation protein AA AAA+ ATPase domain-containing protein [Deinococcus saxicola]|uniref:AAA family ATPase n=1 Tax=Deinococcus saxicola TaxID=249406 RepID=UPI0039EF1AEC
MILPGTARLTRRVTLGVQPVFDQSSDEEFSSMLAMLPPKVRDIVGPRIREVEEIRLQAFSPLEVLYRHAHVIYPVTFSMEEMATLDSIGQWRADGRLGLEGTLHRFGRLDTGNHTSMVTVRVARAYVGIAEPLREWLDKADDGLVIIGMPGAGKTALLRDCNRILGERLAGRLFVCDSSNEILGDGFRPHPITDWLSRVPIGDPAKQLSKLNQVVKNFQPRWMEVDEVSSREDARAIAYARSRGARAVMTWHAENLKAAYEESEERTLWPLLQRNERGLSGPPVASLGILVRGRGEYVVFENLGECFGAVAAGELPPGVQVSVAQPGRWDGRQANWKGEQG